MKPKLIIEGIFVVLVVIALVVVITFTVLSVACHFDQFASLDTQARICQREISATDGFE